MAKQRESLFGEEDCERPACDDIKQALPKSMEEVQALTQKHAAKQKVECPPRGAELGRSSWKLMHTMVRSENSLYALSYYLSKLTEIVETTAFVLLQIKAAWYPDKPSSEEKQNMNGFFQALSLFYPCTWCAVDFQEEIKKTPPA